MLCSACTIYHRFCRNQLTNEPLYAALHNNHCHIWLEWKWVAFHIRHLICWFFHICILSSSIIPYDWTQVYSMHTHSLSSFQFTFKLADDQRYDAYFSSKLIRSIDLSVRLSKICQKINVKVRRGSIALVKSSKIWRIDLSFCWEFDQPIESSRILQIGWAHVGYDIYKLFFPGSNKQQIKFLLLFLVRNRIRAALIVVELVKFGMEFNVHGAGYNHHSSMRKEQTELLTTRAH